MWLSFIPNPAQYNSVPNPSLGMEFCPLIRSKNRISSFYLESMLPPQSTADVGGNNRILVLLPQLRIDVKLRVFQSFKIVGYMDIGQKK